MNSDFKIIPVIFPLLFLDCISSSILGDLPVHFDRKIDGACSHYRKEGNNYIVFVRGNLQRNTFGIYKLSFEADSSDTIYLGNRNIRFLGTGSGGCEIDNIRNISSDDALLSIKFIDEKGVTHYVVIGKKKQLNKHVYWVLLGA